MKKQLLLINLIVFFLFSSCFKQTSSSAIDQLNEIKSTVGSEGEIKINNSIVKSNVTTNSIDNPTINIGKNLSLKEFKDAYKSLKENRKKEFQLTNIHYSKDTVLKHDSASSIKIKPFDLMYDEGENPGIRPAGYYTITNYSSILQNNNGNSSLFSNMVLVFNTNNLGMVIGTPSIYYTSVNLFTWNQLYVSPIAFDPNTHISTFTISGTSTFGISLGGSLLGWVSPQSFQVSINMDANSSWLDRIIDITTP